MRWLLGASVGMSACSFRPGTLTGGPSDAPMADTIDTGVDSPAGLYCGEPDLVFCFQFEGSVQDGTPNDLDAVATNVAFVTGKAGLAMAFGATSAADVPDSARFDVQAMTIEAWINPAQIPGAGLRAGIVYVDPQYGMFLHELGELQCTVTGGIALRVTPNIPANQWTHVACSYNGTTTTVYVNGVAVGTGTGGGAISTTGTTGMSLAADNPPGSGARLIGLIDEVRMFSVARTGPQICQDALVCP